MGQAVPTRGRQRALHQAALGRADLGDAGDVEQRLSGRDLELAPQRIGAAQQRHVGGMLEIAQTNDAGAAVGGAAVVTRRIALKPENALSAACQCVDGRAAHDTKAADDDIEIGHSPLLVLREGYHENRCRPAVRRGPFGRGRGRGTCAGEACSGCHRDRVLRARRRAGRALAASATRAAGDGGRAPVRAGCTGGGGGAIRLSAAVDLRARDCPLYPAAHRRRRMRGGGRGAAGSGRARR